MSVALFLTQTKSLRISTCEGPGSALNNSNERVSYISSSLSTNLCRAINEVVLAKSSKVYVKREMKDNWSLLLDLELQLGFKAEFVTCLNLLLFLCLLLSK